MANVVIRLVTGDFKRRVTRHIKRLAGAVGFPFSFTLQTHAAATTHAFHDFWCARIEGQRRRQNDTDCFFGAIGKLHGVANALTIKVDVCCFNYGNVIVLSRLDSPQFLNNALGDKTHHTKSQDKK